MHSKYSKKWHKMKHLLSIITTIAFSMICSANNIVERADSAYMAENYPLAVQLYSHAAEKEGVSSTLYYNLGNAMYRTGNLSGAIINYNRALRIDPTNDDARANLEFVNEKIIDKQVDENSLTQKIAETVIDFTTSNNWAIITLICFSIFLLSVAGYLFLTNIGLRKTSFFAAISFLAISAICGIISHKAASRANDRTEAIITATSVQLSTSPRYPQNKTEEAVLLHEGTKIHIMDSVRIATDSISPRWYEVEFRQGQRAWINAKDLEII